MGRREETVPQRNHAENWECSENVQLGEVREWGNTGVFANPMDLGSNWTRARIARCLTVYFQPPRVLCAQCFICSCPIAGSPNTRSGFCLEPDLIWSNSKDSWVFVFILDNQINLNVDSILGDINKLMLFLIGVMLTWCSCKKMSCSTHTTYFFKKRCT